MRRVRVKLSTLLALVVGLSPLALFAADEIVASSDLARVVIELSDRPLATYEDAIPRLRGVLGARTAGGHLDVAAAASRGYLRYLDERQDAFERQLAAASRGAEIHWRYRIAFNGITALLRRDTIPAVRALPGVVAVTETYELEPELDQSRDKLDLPAMWSGFKDSPLGPGDGLRVALLDSGVNPHHPFFSPAGYTAPPGYPKSERVSGGTRTPLPAPLYTSNKVIVGNVYTPPGGNATPWGPGSTHGTHVAGIMAGVEGTYPYTLGGKTWDLTFSGVLPGAYIMSYLPAGDSAEFLAAIEDIVADEADALNISLGHSRWLTGDPVHDPLRKALDAAVAAGTVVAASAGNAGSNGDSTVTGSWKLSDKVITVASNSHGRMFANKLSVTGSATPPARLRDLIAVPAGGTTPPFAVEVSGQYVVAPGGNGPDAGLACSELPPEEVAGKIVLVGRGVCTFEAKKDNVRNAGGIAMIVHNNGPDLPTAMSFTTPAIPAAMISQADGHAMITWAKKDGAPTLAVAPGTERVTTAPADVVSSFSSRGPAPIMRIKPDISAPGFSVLSSVVEGTTGAVGAPLFEMLSGTSMSTPHVTALAAATKGLHPTWTPMQIKSALMNTAHTSMYLDATRSTPASVRDRGAGRVQPARLLNPALTFDPPSVSLGMVRAGETAATTVTATDMRGRGPSKSWAVSVRAVKGHDRVVVTPTPSPATAPGGAASIAIRVSTAGAPAGDYEGFVEIRSGSERYTLPYWVRVQPAAAKDVLLIDWDRNLPEDLSGPYKDALRKLGLTFDVFDGGTSAAANAAPGPTLLQLQAYRTVILFTGNNSASWSNAHIGGSFALQGYLLGGGRLIMAGQDLQSQIVNNQNQGSDSMLTSMGGWISGMTAVETPAACQVVISDSNFYRDATPIEDLTTVLELFGGTVDVSSTASGGPGAQTRPDAGRAVTADDDVNTCLRVYNADAIGPHARVLGSYVTTRRNGIDVPRAENAAATGVAPDTTLERRSRLVPWTAAVLHVGIEGVNEGQGRLSRAATLGRLYDFANDTVTVEVSQTARDGASVDLVAKASSTRDAKIVKYRWDFGDGSGIKETTTNRVRQTYAKGVYTVRVEAVTELTRSGVGVATIDTRTSVLNNRTPRKPAPAKDLPATEYDGPIPETDARRGIEQPRSVLAAPKPVLETIRGPVDAQPDHTSWILLAFTIWAATAAPLTARFAGAGRRRTG